MLKVKVTEKNRKYMRRMLTIVLFGITGLLIVPIVNSIVKFANYYPRAFKWVSISIYVCVCIYGLFFARNWNARIVIICSIVAVVVINKRNKDGGQ